MMTVLMTQTTKNCLMDQVMKIDALIKGNSDTDTSSQMAFSIYVDPKGNLVGDIG